MTFAELVRQHADKAKELKGIVQTEEATKTALILTFFKDVLDYDIFDPIEFVPEASATIDKTKWGSIDYVVQISGKPVIIVEAKHVDVNLDNHTQQLFRYFASSDARFAILTNGIEYRFYSDIEQSNKMDLKPFMSVDFLNLKDAQIQALQRFCKKEFDADTLHDAANEMKWHGEIRAAFKEQLANPSDDFVRLLISHAYKGEKTKAVMNRFRPFVKAAITGYINEAIHDRILADPKSNDQGAGSDNDGEPHDDFEPFEKQMFETVSLLFDDDSFKKSRFRMYQQKEHLAIWYRNSMLCLFHYNADKTALIDIQFMQPFMEEGCNWRKRERRDSHPIGNMSEIQIYADRLIAAAEDIDECYIESARRKAK
ncbi:MAG: type I restriction enzyme HsdR N-terminal domain-containing protein [Gracilibacteraceae bacterium]|jgi:hypothetical protein|nr:type I restriction enzyme HsdR N-terminal domain-containing protein [Gracilibacteraceae bacterium]